jgi:hypothetical protein
MSVIVESRIIGTFLGYGPCIVHRLDDGSEWEQVGNTKEYVYRERPGFRSSLTVSGSGSTWRGQVG